MFHLNKILRQKLVVQFYNNSILYNFNILTSGEINLVRANFTLWSFLDLTETSSYFKSTNKHFGNAFAI